MARTTLTLERNPALMGELSKASADDDRVSKLHSAASEDGVLDTKTKELIALGIAIAIRCDGCIAFHVCDALSAGATEEEILETIGSAILMGGGPAVMYGCEAWEALKQFKKERASANGH